MRVRAMRKQKWQCGAAIEAMLLRDADDAIQYRLFMLRYAPDI